MVNITGNADGSSAVDYTINPATGFPWATGPRNLGIPFNHLLPAWDAITGALATTSLLAAERRRARTSAGQYVRIALSDVAFWMVGNLGKIAEVEINRHERVKDGNYLYGAFGRDFRTRDGRRIMIVALTGRQWRSLVAATDLAEACASIEKMMDVDLSDEGGRFTARELIGATLRPWVLSRSIAEVREIFDAHDVCWGPYQTFTELVEQDPRCSPANPLFADVEPRNRAPTECPARWSLGRPSASRLCARRRWASTPRRCWLTCWASPTPKSGGCSVTASLPASPLRRTGKAPANASRSACRGFLAPQVVAADDRWRKCGRHAAGGGAGGRAV